MDALTHDEAILLLAQRQEAGSRASLSEALMRMGRWDEALAVEVDPEKRAFITALKEGEERDDADRCGCVHTVDTTDYVRMGQAIEEGKAEPTVEQAPNYLRTFRHWSSTHGGMVWAYICHLCGHVQGIPGAIDDLHAGHSTEQARVARIEYAKPGASIKGR